MVFSRNSARMFPDSSSIRRRPCTAAYVYSLAVCGHFNENTIQATTSAIQSQDLRSSRQTGSDVPAGANLITHRIQIYQISFVVGTQNLLSTNNNPKQNSKKTPKMCGESQINFIAKIESICFPRFSPFFYFDISVHDAVVCV